ncbi:MAG: type II toxin-antitoxin system HicB family antitoxin [Actinomycetota bacterium]|nr:type II toxin-antitoxin system HicB family antitoxin [Actinomycetota bacterium]
MNTYQASLELDPRSGQWMADIEGLPVHTWGRSLGRVKEYAHEALAAHLDVPPTDVEGHIVFRTPKLPEPVLDALDDAERARTEADSAAERAAKAKAAAAGALVHDAHLTMRDAAEILGISHQRVQQLLTPPPARESVPRRKGNASRRAAS